MIHKLQHGKKIIVAFLHLAEKMENSKEEKIMIVLDVETTGLHPDPTLRMLAEGKTEDYIVANGLMNDSKLNVFTLPFHCFQESLEASEKEILISSCKWLQENKQETMITYNGKSFDIPFITTKLLKYPELEINPDFLLSMNHIDLMDFSKKVCGRYISKESACRKLGNLYVPRISDGMWNARIYKNPQLLTANEHMDMIQHNATDLTATARLYNVLKDFPDFQEWVESTCPESNIFRHLREDEI